MARARSSLLVLAVLHAICVTLTLYVYIYSDSFPLIALPKSTVLSNPIKFELPHSIKDVHAFLDGRMEANGDGLGEWADRSVRLSWALFFHASLTILLLVRRLGRGGAGAFNGQNGTIRHRAPNLHHI